MEYLSLKNGVKMPLVGYGVADIRDEARCGALLAEALAAGYRMIDTAAAYENEKAVGNVVKKSGIPREELFLTTKIWIQDYGYEKAKRAFQKSLERLGTDYIDLYLIHQPIGDIHETWRAVEEMYRKGYARAVGVSNFEMGKVAEVSVFHSQMPYVNQIEMNLLCQQKELLQYLKENGIAAEAWGVFARGTMGILEEPVIRKLGRKHKKTPAQIILRWMTQREVPVLIQSENGVHMRENLDIFDFRLEEEELEQIAELDLERSVYLNYSLPETVARLGTARFNT